jgi:rsbT co-antagonist protein RsbR
LAERNQGLIESEAANAELVVRLKAAVAELSTPIIEVWDDVLALPVIGVVDSERSSEITARLLEQVVQTGARFVIIDWTGVEVMDSLTAVHFLNLVNAVGLVGARCIITGIRPPVAQTLVELGVGFGSLVTLRNLRHGLRYCITQLRAETKETASPRRIAQ